MQASRRAIRAMPTRRREDADGTPRPVGPTRPRLAPRRDRPSRGAFDEIEDGARRPTERVDPRRRPVVAPKDNVLRRERHQPDWSILVAVVALAAIGILMVYSSSAMRAYVQQDDTLAIVGPQILWAALGMIAMLVMMRVDYRLLRIASLPAYVVAIGLLILVFVPSLNKVVGGSARWLAIPGVPAVHPAEIAKLALIVYLAHWLSSRGTRIKGFRSGTVPFLLITLPIAASSSRNPTSAPRPSSPPRPSRCSSSPARGCGNSGRWG